MTNKSYSKVPCAYVVCVALPVLLILAMIGATVDGAITSAHYMSIGCHTYPVNGGELERCQGLYTIDRTWDEAVARCQSDGWNGLAVADNDEVEDVLGKYMIWMNEELDADNGYRAWIAGHEVNDRVWKWSDGAAFQRQLSYIYLLTYFRFIY